MVEEAKGQSHHLFTPDTTTLHLRNIETSDTLSPEKLPDSYNQLKEKASQNNLARKLFSAVIREPGAPTTDEHKSIEEDFNPYAGKTIRDIHIIILAPFGTNIMEPDSINQSNHFNNVANDLHARTKEYIVRNNLQFKKGETINPMVLAESEAFLRSTGYINDARIRIEPDSLVDDYVDVYVIVRDVWSIGITIDNISTSKLNVGLFDKNFLGIGSRLDANVLYSNKYSKKFGFGVGYLYKNLMRTFIDLQGSYSDDITSHQYSLSVERKLQTTLDYFGQVNYYQNRLQPEYLEWDSISPDYDQNFSLSIGRAITLPCHYATRRFVVAARYMEQNPQYRYQIFRDYIHEKELIPYRYTRSRFLLTQLSLYQQAYYREHMIHNFGVTEDIAHGYNISGQFGYKDFRQYEDGMYGSLSASGGRNFKFGNLYSEMSISSFFNEEETYEGVFKMGVRYFSPLMRIGALGRFRQFVNLDYTKLLNPIPFFDNGVYFSGLSALTTRNFDWQTRGTERFMLNTETDLFSTLNIVGFRFLFYNFVDIAWITPQSNLFGKNNFYWGTGLGIRIRNDLLVFRTIDIKIGIYPKFDQSSFSEYFNVETSTPKVSPSFLPSYPQEIPLE